MADVETKKIVNDALTEAAKNFAVDSINLVAKELLLFKNQVTDLKIKLELARDRKDRSNLTKSMKSAYQLIMNFRNTILGPGNKISYRIYVQGEDINSVTIVDLTEEELMSYVERSQNDLRLKRTLKNIENLKTKSNIQSLFDNHFKNISRSLYQIDGSHNYVVPFNSIVDIGSHEKVFPNLYWQVDNGRGKSAYTPKLFNRGWIYQAFEDTVYNVYSDADSEQKVSNLQIRREYFKTYLDYDNVVGFRGGDVGLNQIKTNAANLINITTLINYLTILEDLLTSTDLSAERLVGVLKEKFTNQENLTQQVEMRIENVAEQLINELRKIPNIT